MTSTDTNMQRPATSYAEKLMQPAIIAYAANEEDIKQVIKFATEKNIAVSITAGKQICFLLICDVCKSS